MLYFLPKLRFTLIFVSFFSIACKNSNVSSMEQKDPLAAKADSGLCGYLHTATLCTNDLSLIKNFYVEGMGMSLEGPIALSVQQINTQKDLWKLSDENTYSYYHLYRKEVPSLIQIRLLVFDNIQESIHNSYNALELGPFSLGFPNMNQKKLDKHLIDLGIGTMADLQEGTIPRPDGSEYRYWETIYKAPDFLHAVGIERGDGMPQLSPCDSLTELGGPGYSAQVIDNSDYFISFLTNVLDLELRADRQWDASPGSALGIEEGTPFRFALVYAKGSSQNHFLFLDFKESEMVDTGVAPRIPNNGLAAWTLETKNIAQVHKNAIEFGCTIVSVPRSYDSPIFGKVEIMSMHAPNGFLIEVFQKMNNG